MNTLTCACGKTYPNTPAGRLAHRTLHGHAPSRPALQLANPPSEEV